MNTTQLERECSTYARYLIGQLPTRYVIAQYVAFHRATGALTDAKFDSFDRFLVKVSAGGPLWARLTDSYASVFRKDSVLRKKLVLMLAILECAPPSFEALDRVDGGGWLLTASRLGFWASRYALALFVSTLIFTPVRLGKALSWKRRPVAILER